MRPTQLLRMRPSPFHRMNPTRVRRSGGTPLPPPDPTKPLTNSNFTPQMSNGFNKYGGYFFECCLWFWIMYHMREQFAVRLGWRYSFQSLGHPFSEEGLSGGRLGSWPARMGWVKNPGGDEY